MNKLMFIGALLGLTTASVPASAYTLTVTNGTTKSFYPDIDGIARIGGTMFGSRSDADQNSHVRIDKRPGRLTVYYNAGWLHGGPEIKPGETAKFVFEGWDIGFCFNTDTVKLFFKDAAMVHVPVKSLPSDYWDSLTGSISNFGNSVTTAGDKFGGGESSPQQMKIAGQTVGALGGLVGPIADLVGKSTCKDISLIISIKDGQAVAVTPEIH